LIRVIHTTLTLLTSSVSLLVQAGISVISTPLQRVGYYLGLAQEFI